MFSHEKLDVYRQSIKFYACSITLEKCLPRGSADIRDQLKRAALSIPLNIAEGTGKPTRADRARFFAIARGSAFECAAILDAFEVLGVATGATLGEGRERLTRIVAMLTKMCR